MITLLSGGTGTPKLLRGIRHHVPDEEISVVVNTAEDTWISGGHMSPDVDTVLYLFAGLLNTETWWGIAGDSFKTHDALLGLGTDEYIAIGDKDRAVQIARGELLRGGLSLTEATATLCTRMGIRARVLPMADSPVATEVWAGGEFIHFQEYWVRHKGKVAIDAVRRTPDPSPPATPEVIRSIHDADLVIIGPSNPVTSILPILECGGVRQAMKGRPVVAVSPFIGETPFSGPAGELMRATGRTPSSVGTWEIYRDIAGLFIQDQQDTLQVPGAARLDTMMTREEKSATLAGEILSLARERLP